MSELAFRLIAGAIAAMAIAVVAWRAGSLTASGAVAAVFTGMAAAAAGLDWAGLLIVYFVTATLLSRLGRRRKLRLTGSTVAKAGPRDAVQVLSNGLPFALAAIAETLQPGSDLLLMAIAGGSLAASAADTWATEVGTFVGQRPRSILNGRILPVGASGGVTLAGSAASVAGACFIAAVASQFAGWPTAIVAYPVFVGGLAGSIADSVLGATAQRRSWCDACGQPTEMRIHSCGTPTRQTGGVAFVENDAVNLAANTIGALVAAWVGGPWSA